MKSPRSILLGRHQKAEARLDQIRVRTLAAIPLHAPASEPMPAPTSVWQMLWLELFHKPRAAWAGIGACGLLALGLNSLALLTSGRPDPIPVTPLVAVQEAVRERAQLLAELRGQGPSPSSELELTPVATPDRTRRRSAISTKAGQWFV